MEMIEMENQHKQVLQEIINYVNTIMGYIDLYEHNRPASIAKTKLDEAVMWCQVMVSSIPLKDDVVNMLNQKKEEINNQQPVD